MRTFQMIGFMKSFTHLQPFSYNSPEDSCYCSPVPWVISRPTNKRNIQIHPTGAMWGPIRHPAGPCTSHVWISTYKTVTAFNFTLSFIIIIVIIIIIIIIIIFIIIIIIKYYFFYIQATLSCQTKVDVSLCVSYTAIISLALWRECQPLYLYKIRALLPVNILSQSKELLKLWDRW